MFHVGDLVRIKDWASGSSFIWGTCAKIRQEVLGRGYRLETRGRVLDNSVFNKDWLEPAFKEGTRVRIKSFERMREEFGGSEVTIHTPTFFFVDKMKPLCGLYATIDRVSGRKIFLTNWSDKEIHRESIGCNGLDWSYSTYMVEPVEKMWVLFDYKDRNIPIEMEEVVTALRVEGIACFESEVSPVPGIFYRPRIERGGFDFIIDVSDEVDWDLVKEFLLNENMIRMGKNS